MPQPLWIQPTPAQADDFLQLHYENQYGMPEGASTSIYLHPWSIPDQIGLAAEVEIYRDGYPCGDDGFRVRLITYSWSVGTGTGWGSPHQFERFDGCTCQAWESAETLGSFYDAEELALFAWKRWRATGRGGAACLLLRQDLDSQLNPIA